jgi:hypothetical protein
LAGETLNLAELVAATVGESRYRDACAWAWRDPTESWPDDLAYVPHDLSELWELNELPLARRLELALELYRAMPCYANTMYITSRYREFGGTERRMLWDAYRAALDSDDDRLADPIAYSLWVDYFEDAPRIAKQAWQEVTHAPSDTRLRRALAVAGPVPWKVKAPLLESLLDSLEWHRGVLYALEGVRRVRGRRAAHRARLARPAAAPPRRRRAGARAPQLG